MKPVKLFPLLLLLALLLVSSQAGAATSRGRCTEICEHRFEECMDDINKADAMELQEQGGVCRERKIACANDCTIDVPDTVRKPKAQEPAQPQERPAEKQAPRSELKQVSSDDPKKCSVFAGFEGCEETHSCICLQ